MAEMTADEMLRKRAEELAHSLDDQMFEAIPYEGFSELKESILKVMLAFAAEQSALARADLVAECATLCDKLRDEYPNNDLRYSAMRGLCIEIKESIKNLSPAGDSALPREITVDHVRRALSYTFYGDLRERKDNPLFVRVYDDGDGIPIDEAAIDIHKAVLAAAGKD